MKKTGIWFFPATLVSALLFGNLYVSRWTWEAFWISYQIAVVFFVVFVIIMDFIVPLILGKVKPETRSFSRRTVLLDILVYLPAAAVGIYVSLVFAGLITGIDFFKTDRLIYFQFLIGVAISLMIGASIYAASFYREMIRNMEAARQAEELAVQAELKALKAQINPHFLFNTLNTISALISVDPKQADEMTHKLADIFRYVLQSSEKDLVLLRDEVAFITDYLQIEKARFADRLILSQEIDPVSLSTRMPGLILQPLVENALRHGISDNVSGGTLRITSRIDNGTVFLRVLDDGSSVKDSAPTAGLGIGLKNVNDRIQKRFGKEFGVRLSAEPGSGTCAEITLPFNPERET